MIRTENLPPDERVRVNIARLVEDARTEKLIAMFFDGDRPFAGYTFHTLAPNNPFTVDESDLLAVTLLDVSIPAKAVREMLFDEAKRAAISRLLQAIEPVDLPLWAADPPLAQAQDLWNHLQDSFSGIGGVIAGKILARKRPSLIPIVDRVVAHVLAGAPGRYWESIRGALVDEYLRERIDQLGQSLPQPVPTIRLLDAAIWMTGSDSDNARACRRQLGFHIPER